MLFELVQLFLPELFEIWFRGPDLFEIEQVQARFPIVHGFAFLKILGDKGLIALGFDKYFLQRLIPSDEMPQFSDQHLIFEVDPVYAADVVDEDLAESGGFHAEYL